MKKVYGITLIALILLSMSVAAQAQREIVMPSPATRIRIVFEGGEAVVSMFDNLQAREFLAMLPLSVKLDDFSHMEKVCYLSKKLDIKGGENAEEKEGDFCYYAPWGNLAVFYKGMGYGTSLYVLGRIEKGKDLLSQKEGSFSARMEVVQ